MKNLYDSRFPTSNTNLAAALAALRIPVKSDSPILRTVDESDGTCRFFFFFEQKGVEFCGAQHEAEKIAAGWSDRAKFESLNPTHPLVYIRAALEARDWNNRAWHGEVNPGNGHGEKFRTSDEILAACWKACGAKVVGVNRGEWLFSSAPTREFRKFFDRWNEPDGRENAVALMRRAIECRAVLLDLYRQCRAQRRIVLGDPASGDWTELLAGADASQESIEEAIANL